MIMFWYIKAIQYINKLIYNEKNILIDWKEI